MKYQSHSSWENRKNSSVCHLLTILPSMLGFQLFILKISEKLGPVVQSIISLSSLLRVISLTVLADSIYNILILFAEKM